MEVAEWLKPYLNENCPYCHSPIINNENLTDRYCSNPACPGHMSYKISALATRFGAKGIGPATALAMIEAVKLPYHVNYIRAFLPAPPKLYLWQVGEIAMIKGHQNRWKEYADGCDTMEEVCNKASVPKVIKEHKRLLLAAERECIVLPRLKGLKINIMMSGSFDGYSARRDWLAAMNAKYGDAFELVDVGVRKLDVQYLVKESWATDHSKSAIARDYSIPIVTPAQMEEILSAGKAYIFRGGAG